MMEIHEDYVRIADKQCPICGDIHQHNSEILMNMRGKAVKTDDNGYVITGRSLCEKHAKLHEAGYLAMVVISNTGQDQGREEHAR